MELFREIEHTWVSILAKYLFQDILFLNTLIPFIFFLFVLYFTNN